MLNRNLLRRLAYHHSALVARRLAGLRGGVVGNHGFGPKGPVGLRQERQGTEIVLWVELWVGFLLSSTAKQPFGYH
jgi:hypothetical protein